MGVEETVRVLHKPAEDYGEEREKGRDGAALEKLSK